MISAIIFVCNSISRIAVAIQFKHAVSKSYDTPFHKDEHPKLVDRKISVMLNDL